jgi:orotidine-5'-phosphate decarboxylase
MTGTPFADRLAAAIDAAGSPVCVGLDPVYDKLPGELRCGTGGLASSPGSGPVPAIARFCEGLLEACRGIAPVVKPQSACFERFGSEGLACLRHVCRRAREMGYLVLLDAKRGDIGISAEHYAAFAFDQMAADAVTLSGYLGPDTLEPFLTDPSRGIFVLVRTSNPGSDAVQSARLADGRTVAELLADHVDTLGRSRLGVRGLSSVGAVVGATKAADAAALRARMPHTVFLIPGYGAQGGSASDLKPMLIPNAATPAQSGLLVTASRSVIYAFGQDSTDWTTKVERAARAMAAEVAAIVRA